MKQPSSYLVTLIIVLNTIVFGMWWLAELGRVSPQMMTDNFLVSWNALIEGRFWVLIGSVFSHAQLFHFLINMMVLSSFGRVLEIFLGHKFFLGFYLIAGVISSLAHAVVSAFLLGEPSLPALGASGSVAGCVLLFALLFPKEKLLLFGIVPVPAIWGAVAFVGLDIWGLIAQAEGGGLPIGHGAHLGGSFTGLITYLFIIRPRLRRIAQRQASPLVREG